MAPGEGSLVLRVVVVDDESLFARSLELALPSASGGRISVGATAETAAEAITAFEQYRPDVALVDLDLPGGGALELNPTKLIAVAEAEDTQEAVGVDVRVRVRAIVGRGARIEHLLAPVLAVMQGWRVVPDRLLEDLVRRSQRRGSDILVGLDDETDQLWMLVAEGLDIEAISARLDASERTTKRLIADLRTRVGAANRTQSATMVGQVGLVDAGWPQPTSVPAR